jgi:hypothetical protein
MKKLIFLVLLIGLAFPLRAQTSSKKLTTDEAARKTPDQRFVYETERKSKKKKKQLSTKKKVRIQEKQEAKVKKKKDPKRRRN